MRAILIDPEKRTLTEIEITGNDDDLEEIYALLHCKRFASSGRNLNGSLEAGFDNILVSDDDMEDRDDPRFWFQVDADRDPPSSYPIAGRGLAVGVGRKGESR